MRITSQPSSSHLAHLATGKRFASLPHRLLATTNGLVIALALSVLPPSDAVAANIQYLSQSIIDWGGYAENSGVGKTVCPNPFSSCNFREFALPQFNPALGTLREVDFAAQISILGDVEATAGGLGRTSTATLFATAGIYLDSSSIDRGPRGSSGIDFGPNLFLNIQNQAQCESGFFGKPCSSDSGTFGNFTTQSAIFTGTSVTPFVGPGQINFFSGHFPANASYEMGLSHTDDGIHIANAADSGILEANAPCFGVAECLAELAVAVYETAAADGSISLGCCEGFGSVHMLRLVDIAYTYDPPAAPAVPEPSTLALLSIALTALVVARGCRRRHTRNQRCYGWLLTALRYTRSG
jgi:PEP-CTERM motif-containing protein